MCSSDLLYSRHLDISQSTENASIYRDPNETLAELVQNLPHLTSLDISGTNLAGRGKLPIRHHQLTVLPLAIDHVHLSLA